MSYCEIHKRKSSKGRNNVTFSNCGKTSMPSCKKINGHSHKNCTNQHVFSNAKLHCSKARIDRNCEKPLENSSQNLGNQHDASDLHESQKSELCKTHNKHKKISTVYNHLLNGKHSAYLTCQDCSVHQKYCANSTKNSEDAAELKTSKPHRKHCLDNTNVTEEVTQSNDSIPHTDCKYCHCDNTSERRTKLKSSIPHTDCKYCRNNNDSVNKGATELKISLPHTDCKYCRNNISNKREVKSKNPLPHTDCKYCLNNTNSLEELTEISSVSTGSISLAEELPDELLNVCSTNGHRYIPCSLHDPYTILDPLHLHSPYCEMYYRRSASCVGSLCEYPEFCLINNESPFHIRDYITDRRSQSLQEFNIQNNIEKPIKFKPCEFCLRNGETPIIYNSHQFRNTHGIVTCPILRQNSCPECEITGSFESCSRNNYDEIAINTIYGHNSIPHVGRAFRESVNGCVSCSLLGLQSISSSDLYASESSSEIPHSYYFQNKPDLYGNRSYTNFDEGFYPTEKHHDSKCVSNLKLPTFMQYDTKIPVSKYTNQNYTSKLQQRNTNKRKSKKSVSCQFCLTTGKPPYIYNSHELRDESGANLQCPILKEHMNKISNVAHPCCGPSCNIFEGEMHLPLAQRVSNGLLSKCQYFDLVDCLV